jgi:hypothetical protein
VLPELWNAADVRHRAGDDVMESDEPSFPHEGRIHSEIRFDAGSRVIAVDEEKVHWLTAQGILHLSARFASVRIGGNEHDALAGTAERAIQPGAPFVRAPPAEYALSIRGVDGDENGIRPRHGGEQKQSTAPTGSNLDHGPRPFPYEQLQQRPQLGRDLHRPNRETGVLETRGECNCLVERQWMRITHRSCRASSRERIRGLLKRFGTSPQYPCCEHERATVGPRLPSAAKGAATVSYSRHGTSMARFAETSAANSG